VPFRSELRCDRARRLRYRRRVVNGSRSWRPLAMLALCALLMRAWVPAGWMPAEAGDGALLAPCPAAGPPGIAAEHRPMHHGHSGPASHSGDEHKPCAFAGLTLSLLDPPPAALPPAPARAGEGGPLPIAPAAVGRGLAAPPPPATGPPIA
jgi:hypothetical protein